MSTGLLEHGPEHSRLLVRLLRELAKDEPLGPGDIDEAAEAQA